MSEKIYACLLRLFPRRFRETYGEAALQLFRDRSRNENGFLRSLRLWQDLLEDVAISIPREYRNARASLASSSVLQGLEGTPSLFVLGDESPRLGPLILGGVLSLLALNMFSVLINHAEGRRSRGFAIVQRQDAGEAYPSAAGRSPEPPADDREDKIKASRVAQSPALDAGERHRVISAVVANLKQHYVDPEDARKMAEALLAHEKNGDDDMATDGETFAVLLTRQMREVSHDTHLEVIYSRDALPDLTIGATPEELARYRKALEQDNCRFKKVEILSNNIGYLKLNAFPDPAVCQATATAAMASLNNADAIIFDLRDNHGGEPEMVAMMAAYLFDHPEYWYNPRENTTQNSWTRSPVPGNRLADKPVYVLTSAGTFSGAEQFCYDLRMLKRATIVGETTGGAAHAGVFHRIDDHFGIGIPESRPINPFGKADWAETGVEPDVKVKAGDALETAVKLAASKLEAKR
jgi:Peptidase family S41/N-terminal domain of Peptidase_S41 in eukaryotic IRBP